MLISLRLILLAIDGAVILINKTIINKLHVSSVFLQNKKNINQDGFFSISPVHTLYYVKHVLVIHLRVQ